MLVYRRVTTKGCWVGFLPRNIHGFNMFNLADLASLKNFGDYSPENERIPPQKRTMSTVCSSSNLRFLGDMLVGGSTITLVQDSSGTLACVFQAPGERVHPFQEKWKSVMKDRDHYITNPNKALLSGNASNLPCIRIVWSPKMGNLIILERWTPSIRVSVPNMVGCLMILILNKLRWYPQHRIPKKNSNKSVNQNME